MIIVRPALERELDDVVRVLRAAFEAYGPPNGAEGDGPLERAFARYLEEAVDVRARWREAELFVAVEDDLVVGTGTLYPPGRGRHGARATTGGPPWPEGWAGLRLLAVDPRHRRRGIGRMIVDARVSRARALGAPFVALHTTKEFVAAHRMIQRLGWERRSDLDHAPAPGVHAEAYVLALR